MGDLKSWHNNLPNAAREDELEQARIVLRNRLHSTPNPMRGCTSYVQRKLGCSYTHAALILDEMVDRGWITQPDETGARTLA